MSQQINFFHDNEDISLIFEFFVTVFQDFYLVHERGEVLHLKPSSIKSIQEFQVFCESDDLLFLVLSGNIKKISLRKVKENIYRVDPNNSPVLEFSPSKIIEKNDTLRVGRIMYSYDADSDMKRLVVSLIRKIRKVSDKIPESSGFWLMPNAKNYKYLQYWLGKPRKNPHHSHSR